MANRRQPKTRLPWTRGATQRLTLMRACETHSSGLVSSLPEHLRWLPWFPGHICSGDADQVAVEIIFKSMCTIESFYRHSEKHTCIHSSHWALARHASFTKLFLRSKPVVFQHFKQPELVAIVVCLFGKRVLLNAKRTIHLCG